MNPHLDVRQGLSVKNKPLPAPHGVVDVEVLHAQDVLVNIERVQVPVQHEFSTAVPEQLCDLPYHGAQGLHRALLAGHVSYSLGDSRAQAVCGVGQLVVLVGRREELLQLLEGLVVRQPLAVPKTRPETAAREDGLEQTRGGHGEVPLQSGSDWFCP